MKAFGPKEKGMTMGALALFALLGMASMLYATSRGIGISPDSVVYVDSARHLLNGRGFVATSFCGGSEAPVTVWPPLLPLLLSILGRSGIDALHGARWLNVFLFAGNSLLVGRVVHKFTSGSAFLTILGSFFMITSPVMLHIHTMAWTEPLFIFLGLMGLFLLARYIQEEGRSLLVAASVTQNPEIGTAER
jgi:hypothetical protein